MFSALAYVDNYLKRQTSDAFRCMGTFAEVGYKLYQKVPLINEHVTLDPKSVATFIDMTKQEKTGYSGLISAPSALIKMTKYSWTMLSGLGEWAKGAYKGSGKKLTEIEFKLQEKPQKIGRACLTFIGEAGNCASKVCDTIKVSQRFHLIETKLPYLSRVKSACLSVFFACNIIPTVNNLFVRKESDWKKEVSKGRDDAFAYQKRAEMFSLAGLVCNLAVNMSTVLDKALPEAWSLPAACVIAGTGFASFVFKEKADKLANT